MSDENGLPATETTAHDTTVITDEGSSGDIGIKVAGPLNEDNRALIEAKKWASEDGAIDLNKIAEGYRNLETHASKSLRVPGEDATPEDWNAFYSKLGRPEKPEGYELKLNSETVPEDFPYDEASAVEFRNWAHEAGLTPHQAQKLHDKFVEYQAGQFGSVKEQAVQKEAGAHREIIQQWGDPESQGYKQNLEFATRAISQLGLKDALVESGVLSQDGALRNAKFASAMAKVGKELYSEDVFANAATGMLSNPFSDGSNFNLTKQGHLLRSDPGKAKALIRAAGKRPEDYGL
ncbi:hypothetical protein [Nitratireductor basaltis]|uniref:Uncharacterized protein n=1 Tax=Nitratireductor basaltis TaxID=472175 RepID=A0A084UDJ8_9HYPH|nr:hypothetical protein [Nitratireductor basaltis]KFB11034.1 hypothetical protein EL18_02076 [Nitratireductor basaltis]